MQNLKLPINWFDVTVLVLILVGIQRGRKRGMSEEFLVCTKWLMIVGLCAVAYEPLGALLSGSAAIGRMWAYIFCYVGVALVVALVFWGIKRSFGGKLIGSDKFGSSEYYLGMPAGMLRFLCMLFVFLALLNARLYRTSEVVDMEKYQKEVYGSDFFPTLHTVQAQVFEESFIGPQIKKYLSFMLIKPTYPEAKEIVRAKERNY